MKRTEPTIRQRGFWHHAISSLLLVTVWFAVHSLTGCEGGSTGVDNPGLSRLPVEFQDANGNTYAENGILEVYARNHNPALDSQPLLRIYIERSSEIELIADDFARIGTASTREVGELSKRAVYASTRRWASPLETDGLIHFNLLFRSDTKTGISRTGFTFDPVKKSFRMEEGSKPTEVTLRPEPLVEFTSQFQANQVQATSGRIILPGTPFQGTLIDSLFALENVPPGQFAAHFVADGGKVFAIRETLNTQATPTAFTANPEPIAQWKEDIAPADFAVLVGETQEVVARDTIALKGSVVGAATTDSRLAFVWRILFNESKGPATLLNPSKINASIVFPEPGNYQVELAATLGMTTKRDTLMFQVNPPFTIESIAFSRPASNEAITMGSSYKVIWESKTTGKMRLEWLPKDGVALDWKLIADTLSTVVGTNTAMWVIPQLDTVSMPCLMRIRRVGSDSLVGQTPGVFFLNK